MAAQLSADAARRDAAHAKRRGDELHHLVSVQCVQSPHLSPRTPRWFGDSSTPPGPRRPSASPPPPPTVAARAGSKEAEPSRTEMDHRQALREYQRYKQRRIEAEQRAAAAVEAAAAARRSALQRQAAALKDIAGGLTALDGQLRAGSPSPARGRSPARAPVAAAPRVDSEWVAELEEQLVRARAQQEETNRRLRAAEDCVAELRRSIAADVPQQEPVGGVPRDVLEQCAPLCTAVFTDGLRTETSSDGDDVRAVTLADGTRVEEYAPRAFRRIRKRVSLRGGLRSVLGQACATGPDSGSLTSVQSRDRRVTFRLMSAQELAVLRRCANRYADHMELHEGSLLERVIGAFSVCRDDWPHGKLTIGCLLTPNGGQPLTETFDLTGLAGPGDERWRSSGQRLKLCRSSASALLSSLSADLCYLLANGVAGFRLSLATVPQAAEVSERLWTDEGTGQRYLIALEHTLRPSTAEAGPASVAMSALLGFVRGEVIGLEELAEGTEPPPPSEGFASPPRWFPKAPETRGPLAALDGSTHDCELLCTPGVRHQPTPSNSITLSPAGTELLQ
eukprot:TRINITY_DN13776_c0_g1_i2.p1 TRINITY_DN13776_c0_g1~~TRINITY_DN13776_c0_g1_i2.p1  ORF type:complete len:655 (+),score=124.23 TRINITY_DN13776_c0_g1_i2:274-1965(+)